MRYPRPKWYHKLTFVYVIIGVVALLVAVLLMPGAILASVRSL